MLAGLGEWEFDGTWQRFEDETTRLGFACHGRVEFPRTPDATE